MMIDHESARNLELVENATKKKFHSLFGWAMAHALIELMLTTHRTLNHTFTPMAARLLRVTLLAPLNG